MVITEFPTCFFCGQSGNFVVTVQQKQISPYIETASKSVASISDQTIDWVYLKNLDPDSEVFICKPRYRKPTKVTDPQICAHACMVRAKLGWDRTKMEKQVSYDKKTSSQVRNRLGDLIGAIGEKCCWPHCNDIIPSDVSHRDSNANRTCISIRAVTDPFVKIAIMSLLHEFNGGIVNDNSNYHSLLSTMDNSHGVLCTKCSNRIKNFIRLKKEEHSEDDIIGLASLTGRLIANLKFQVDVALGDQNGQLLRKQLAHYRAQKDIIDMIVNNPRREIEIKDIIDFESDYRESYNIDQVTYTMKKKHLLSIICTLRKVRGIVHIQKQVSSHINPAVSKCTFLDSKILFYPPGLPPGFDSFFDTGDDNSERIFGSRGLADCQCDLTAQLIDRLKAPLKDILITYRKKVKEGNFNGEATLHQCASLLHHVFIKLMDEIKAEVNGDNIIKLNSTSRPTKESTNAQAGDKFLAFKSDMESKFADVVSMTFQHPDTETQFQLLGSAMNTLCKFVWPDFSPPDAYNKGVAYMTMSKENLLDFRHVMGETNSSSAIAKKQKRKEDQIVILRGESNPNVQSLIGKDRSSGRVYWPPGATHIELVMIAIWLDNTDQLTGNQDSTKEKSQHGIIRQDRCVKIKLAAELGSTFNLRDGDIIFPLSMNDNVAQNLRSMSCEDANETCTKNPEKTMMEEFIRLMFKHLFKNANDSSNGDDEYSEDVMTFELMCHKVPEVRGPDAIMISGGITNRSTQNNQDVYQTLMDIKMDWPNHCRYSCIPVILDGSLYERASALIGNHCISLKHIFLPLPGLFHLHFHFTKLICRMVGKNQIDMITNHLCPAQEHNTDTKFYRTGKQRIIVTWNVIFRALVKQYMDNEPQDHSNGAGSETKDIDGFFHFLDEEKEKCPAIMDAYYFIRYLGPYYFTMHAGIRWTILPLVLAAFYESWPLFSLCNKTTYDKLAIQSVAVYNTLTPFQRLVLQHLESTSLCGVPGKILSRQIESSSRMLFCEFYFSDFQLGKNLAVDEAGETVECKKVQSSVSYTRDNYAFSDKKLEMASRNRIITDIYLVKCNVPTRTTEYGSDGDNYRAIRYGYQISQCLNAVPSITSGLFSEEYKTAAGHSLSDSVIKAWRSVQDKSILCNAKKDGLNFVRDKILKLTQETNRIFDPNQEIPFLRSQIQKLEELCNSNPHNLEDFTSEIRIKKQELIDLERKFSLIGLIEDVTNDLSGVDNDISITNQSIGEFERDITECEDIMKTLEVECFNCDAEITACMEMVLLGNEAYWDEEEKTQMAAPHIARFENLRIELLAQSTRHTILLESMDESSIRLSYLHQQRDALKTRLLELEDFRKGVRSREAGGFSLFSLIPGNITSLRMMTLIREYESMNSDKSKKQRVSFKKHYRELNQRLSKVLQGKATIHHFLCTPTQLLKESSTELYESNKSSHITYLRKYYPEAFLDRLPFESSFSISVDCPMKIFGCYDKTICTANGIGHRLAEKYVFPIANYFRYIILHMEKTGVFAPKEVKRLMRRKGEKQGSIATGPNFCSDGSSKIYNSRKQFNSAIGNSKVRSYSIIAALEKIKSHYDKNRPLKPLTIFLFGHLDPNNPQKSLYARVDCNPSSPVSVTMFDDDDVCNTAEAELGCCALSGHHMDRLFDDNSIAVDEECWGNQCIVDSEDSDCIWVCLLKHAFHLLDGNSKRWKVYVKKDLHLFVDISTLSEMIASRSNLAPNTTIWRGDNLVTEVDIIMNFVIMNIMAGGSDYSPGFHVSFATLIEYFQKFIREIGGNIDLTLGRIDNDSRTIECDDNNIFLFMAYVYMQMNKTLFNAADGVDHEANLILKPGGTVLSGKDALDTIRKITIDCAVVDHRAPLSINALNFKIARINVILKYWIDSVFKPGTGDPDWRIGRGWVEYQNLCCIHLDINHIGNEDGLFVQKCQHTKCDLKGSKACKCKSSFDQQCTILCGCSHDGGKKCCTSASQQSVDMPIAPSSPTSNTVLPSITINDGTHLAQIPAPAPVVVNIRTETTLPMVVLTNDTDGERDLKRQRISKKPSRYT